MTRPLHVLRPFLRRQWPALVVAAFATVVATAADLANPFPLKFVIDRLFREGHQGRFDVSGGDVALLGAIVGLVLGIALADAVAEYWMDVSLERAGERIVHDLRVATYAQLQRLSLAFHEQQHAGDLATRVTGDVNAVGDLFSDTLGTFVSSGLLLLGMAIVTIVLDPVMALTAFCVTPVLAVVTFRFRGRLRTLSRQQRRKEGEIASTATEALSSMRVIKAFGSEDFEHRRLQRMSEERREFGIEAAEVEGRYGGAVDVLGAVGAALVLSVGVFRVASGHLTPGDLVVVTAYARKVYRPLRQIARQNNKLAKALARAERIADVLAADDVLVDRPDAHRGERATGDLELCDVTFAYSADRSALHDVSLRVPAGTKVAVVGRSGAGKSTLAALVARLYDPSEGRVLLDGRGLRDCSLDWLRDQVAMVLQDTVLFTGDVTENIAYGLAAEPDRVAAAAKAAGAHAFISQLPEGYDTALGPRGLSLSGGERQRIAIARALLRDPPILVLDEPTTGLDAESEAQVLRGLDALMRGRTTILITHSLALARRADHVVVMEDGRIVQEGEPEDLLTAAGTFRTLAAEQGLTERSAAGRGGAVPAVSDPVLPQLPTLLDVDAMAPVLRRSLRVDDEPDVRVRAVRYRAGESVSVHYDVAVGGHWSEAVVTAQPGDGLAVRAARAESVALARQVDGRSPAPFPLAYEDDLDILVQWLPLDLWLPALAETPDGLRRMLRDAGVRVRPADVDVLSYRPRRKVALRIGRHVVKAHGRRDAYVRAEAGLRAGAQMKRVRTPVLEATLPDQLVTVQSLLAGRRPARPEAAAPGAGALLRALHRTRLNRFAPRPAARELDVVAHSFRTAAAVAPWLKGRLEMLLGTLELSRPRDLDACVAHGDFTPRRLVQPRWGELGVTDLDALCVAPPALDLASYAAHVVRGQDGDLDAAEEVLHALVDGYDDEPDGLRWYLATAILRRATLPFRYLDERWPEKVEAMVDAGEAALSR